MQFLLHLSMEYCPPRRCLPSICRKSYCSPVIDSGKIVFGAEWIGMKGWCYAGKQSLERNRIRWWMNCPEKRCYRETCATLNQQETFHFGKTTENLIIVLRNARVYHSEPTPLQNQSTWRRRGSDFCWVMLHDTAKNRLEVAGTLIRMCCPFQNICFRAIILTVSLFVSSSQH